MTEFIHQPVRFTHENERTCDHARPDYRAGLHKHVIENDHEPGTVICVVCGRIWQADPPPVIRIES
jgi:hypothetical protein